MLSEIKMYGQGIKAFWVTATQRGMLFGWITLGVILFFTFFLWYEVKNSTKEESSEKFNIYSTEIQSSIIKRITAYEQVLRGGRGLFIVSDTVTRSEWKIFIENLEVEKNYPGILGIGYTVVVPAASREIHEKMVRAEGFPEYKVWPEGNRDFYTSIVYLEPFEGRNLRAFGYDMMSEPTRQKAMQMARDNGIITVTDKVTLVQETEKDVQAGFLMYLPHYRKGAELNTIESRRESLLGFVYSPFRMHDLMRGILSESLQDINLEIYSGDISSTSLMYVTRPEYMERNTEFEPMYVKEIKLPINNIYWTIRMSTLPSFENNVGEERSIFILIVGLLTSALIFVLVISLSTNNYLFRELNQLIESTGEGIYGLDTRGRCTFINNAASKMLGRKPEELFNQNMHNLMHFKHKDGTLYPLKDCPIYRALNDKTFVRVDKEVFWKSDGTYFPVEYTVSPIITNDGIKGVVVTFNDITEREATIEKLSNSLEEKVVLLKEVHHRVKNNLQIISSLLNLQSQYLKEDGTHEVFKESQNRIRSMALIHEKLYQTNNMSRLNIAGYVHELVMNLLHSYDTSGKINFRMDVEDVLLNIDTAITLGLMINEIVSNSLKHAFPGKPAGEIFVSLKEGGKDQFTLMVSDNGKGMPENLDFRNTESLGLQLVNTLTEQLDGTIEVNSVKGTRFIIKFSAPSEKESYSF